MRRAERLFQLIQLIRGRRLSTAAFLATRLEVSQRSVYRDVADLMAQRDRKRSKAPLKQQSVDGSPGHWIGTPSGGRSESDVEANSPAGARATFV